MKKIAVVVCLAVLGTAIEARADCQYVRGGTTETIIPSNDPLGRVLGNLDGVLNGASTTYLTSSSGLNATSVDVFVTNKGDMLTATGAVTLAPIAAAPPGEFTVNVTLTLTGGFGQYAAATGTITYEGQAHLGGPGPGTFNLIYRGSVCGPNVKGN